MTWLDWIRLALAIGSAVALIVGAVIWRWRQEVRQDQENDHKDGRLR